MEQQAKQGMPVGRPRPIRERRADRLTELVWKRAMQLAVLYPKDLVLDVAGEDGELLRRIGRSIRGVGLAGICATPQLARTARCRVPDADIMYAELDDFPWLNDSFDVALCLVSVPAMRELPAALSEIFRVLKPGGQFLLAASWLPSPFRRLANRFLVEPSGQAVAVLSKRQLLERLERAGFSQAVWLRLSWFRCMAVCWKG
jgi:ubiquinone/menaquinone biosynthesis C-methylase UbiE